VEFIIATVIILLIILGVLYLIFKALTAVNRRRVAERVVIGQIATVVRQNLPLPKALDIAAESEGSRAKKTLRNISILLEKGIALPEAIHLGFPECPAVVISLITAGQKSGQLTMALEQAEQYLVESDRRRHRVIDCACWPYVVVVLLATMLVLSGIMVAVVPKYKAIFADFGTPLPWVTRIVIELFEEFSFVLGLLLMILGFAVPLGMYLDYRPRNLKDLSYPSRIADWLRWHCPGLRRLEFSRGMALMLQTMRVGVRGGMSLETTARAASKIDVNSLLRPRMTEFANLLEGGTNVRKAAEIAGLGEVTAVALAGGQRSQNMDAALRYASDYYDSLVSRWWTMIGNMAWPVCTLMLGTMVGFFVYAMFVPLVALINATATW